MKTKIFVFALAASSLGLAGTVGYYLNTANNQKSPPPPTPAAIPLTPPEKKVFATAPAAPGLTNFVRMDWHQVESDDYRKYVANLRAIGCPEPTIRDIIVADVNKLFEAREKALSGPKTATEFWKKADSRGMSEEKLKQRIQLAKEKRAILKELLGAEYQDKTPLLPSSSDSEERLAFLPKAKQEQISELEATYRAKMNSLFGNKMRPSKADMEQYEKLLAESEAETARILTPQELEDYQLRTSRTAQIMRMSMGDFEMTEQEFRDVFKIKKQYEDQYKLSMGPGPEAPQKVLARIEMDRQIRNVMGEQRYTDYNREQGWATSTLQNVAQEYGLAKENAVKVFDLKPVAQEQAARIQLDANLNDAQKQQALQAVQEETVRSIGELIGKEAAQAYYQQGAWIRNLSGLPSTAGRGTH